MIRNSVADIVALGAVEYGKKAALIIGEQVVSYTELDALCGAFAAGLHEDGLTPGDRVTLYGANCLEWVVAFHGTIRAGGVINPVNMMLTADEIDYVVRDCGAAFVYVEDGKYPEVSRLSSIETLKAVKRFSDVLAIDTKSVTGKARETVNSSADALCMIGYTSGTTGHPKGAMLSNQSVLMNAQFTALMHGRNSDDIVVSALPLSHVYGNVVMNSVLLTGGALVLHSAFGADAILQSISHWRATIFEGVPTMYYYLLDCLEGARADLSSLRLCTVGGQTMPVAKMQLAEEVFDCPLIELWGMTEIAGLGTTHPYMGPYRHGSIGVALPFCETRIVSTENAQQELKPGEIGELLFRGPLVMIGYYNKEEATREAIDAEGWLHTGDVAQIDERGFIHIVDRKKDMILTAGYNIYPAELERVIATHPAVSMSAVGGVPDSQKGEIPKAYIVLKEGAYVGEDEIIAHCRKSLAAYKVPRAVKFVDDLPKTSSGKIMRRALRELDA